MKNGRARGIRWTRTEAGLPGPDGFFDDASVARNAELKGPHSQPTPHRLPQTLTPTTHVKTREGKRGGKKPTLQAKDVPAYLVERALQREMEERRTSRSFRRLCLVGNRSTRGFFNNFAFHSMNMRYISVEIQS